MSQEKINLCTSAMHSNKQELHKFVTLILVTP